MADGNGQGGYAAGGQRQGAGGGVQTEPMHSTVEMKPHGGQVVDEFSRPTGDGQGNGAGDGQSAGQSSGQGPQTRAQAQGRPEGQPNNAAPVADEPPAKKSRRRIIIIAVVLILAAVAALFYWRSTFTEDTDDAQVDGDLYQVSARVAGQVTAVYISENQPVHAGDPIAQIDPRDYEVAVEQAEANLANAKADLVQATANVPITSVQTRTSVTTSGQDVQSNSATVQQLQSSAQAAQARILQAQANALKAQTDVDRYTPLVQRDVISKQQYDAAVATATSAQAQVDEAQRDAMASQQQVQAAQQRLNAARAQAAQSQATAPKQVQAQQARVQAGDASVKQAQARLDQAKLNLGYTKIVAPTDGIVSRKNVAVGDNLSVGQALLTVVPLRNLWVTANFKETQLRGMRQGQIVDLKVDALGGRHFTGRITEVGGATGSRLSLFPPENATGNYVKVVQRIPVRIDFTNLQQENQDNALRAGMSVEPEVHVK